MSKKPDNFSEDANILPYGSNVSAPSLTVPDIDAFKNDRTNNASNYFNERLRAIEEEYKALVDLATQTSMIYNARYNFIPKVGKEYHLYKDGDGYILSLIENWDKFEYVGSYMLTGDNVWQLVQPRDG